MWYAAWLGADAPFGDRARLGRELDRLKALGLNNLRIMAAAEEGPLKNSIKPGFSRPDGTLDPALLGGLDFALAEIARRGMTAVVCLGNFWEWSGGFGTWLYRVTGAYMDMNDPAHPWPAYPDATSAFYANDEAVALYHAHVRAIVDPHQFGDRHALRRRPGDHELAARQRAASRRQRCGRRAQPRGLCAVDRRDRRADPLARRQPPRLARPRRHAGRQRQRGHRPPRARRTSTT